MVMPKTVNGITIHDWMVMPMGVPGGGAGGAPAPPQFVGQTKPVGQYSLYSRAILAYYKKKWDKLCQFFGKFNIGKISMMFRKI
jgi:hypothetical protein